MWINILDKLLQRHRTATVMAHKPKVFLSLVKVTTGLDFILLGVSAYGTTEVP
jgi:hypothetical protein